MFNKSKKIKYFGCLIILLCVIIFLFSNIKIRTVKQVEEERESIIKQQSEFANEIQATGEITKTTEPETQTEIEATTIEQLTEGHTVEGQTVEEQVVEETEVNETISSEGSKTEVSKTQTTQSETKLIKCSIEIRCDNATAKKDSISNPGIRATIPDDGAILAKTEYYGNSGFSVYDVLSQVAEINKIALVTNPSKTYISSIGGLSEKIFGGGLNDTSGWTYRVNGDLPMKAAKYYIVEDGDEITWIYVTGMSD